MYHGQVALGQVGVVSLAQPGGVDSAAPAAGRWPASDSTPDGSTVGPGGGPIPSAPHW